MKGKKNYYPLTLALAKKSKGIRKKRNITQEYVTEEIEKDMKHMKRLSKLMDIK